MLLGSRFKVLLADTGLSVDGAAKLLQVTPRTIQYWIAGKVRVPYAAYKLVRVMRLFELPCEGWQGWHMHSGKLWTPEGYGFDPHDSNWWGLLVRRAAMFSHYYERDRQMDMLMQRIGPDSLRAPEPVAVAKPGTGPEAAGVLTSVAGRGGVAARPNLLLGQLTTKGREKHPLSLEKPPSGKGSKSVTNRSVSANKGGAA